MCLFDRFVSVRSKKGYKLRANYCICKTVQSTSHWIVLFLVDEKKTCTNIAKEEIIILAILFSRHLGSRMIILFPQDKKKSANMTKDEIIIPSKNHSLDLRDSVSTSFVVFCVVCH